MIGTIREKALKIKTVSKQNTEKSHHTRPVLIFAMSWMKAINSFRSMNFSRQMKNQNGSQVGEFDRSLYC